MKILGEGNLHRNDKFVIKRNATLLLTGALRLPLTTEISVQDDFLVESWPLAYPLSRELLYVLVQLSARVVHIRSSAYNYSGMTLTSNHRQHRDMDLKSSSAA